jgi:hypothetical protein
VFGAEGGAGADAVLYKGKALVGVLKLEQGLDELVLSL